MSYLHLPNGIADFSKAVISLWFKAPKEAVIRASQHEGGPDQMLRHILPLITFGREQEAKVYATPSHNVAAIHQYLPGEPDQNTTYNTIYYVEGAPYRLDPCYVGLRCLADGTFNLEFYIQTADQMAFNATSFITTQMDIWSGADPGAPIVSQGNGVVALFPNVGMAAIADASYVTNAVPEYFTVQSDKVLEPDLWHHLLLSFDISGAVSIGTPFASTDCRLWYAIDDVDYRGAENMQPYRDLGGQWGPDTLDPNAILTYQAWRLSGSDPNWEAIHYYQNHFVGLPQGSLEGATVPSNKAPIGIPSASEYVDEVFHVMMAEFQMFLDRTLDTGVESNRHAFIDVKRDADGKPILDGDGHIVMKPADMKKAEELLGKRPEIILHTTSNWKAGKNTGSLGTDDDGNIISSGQFEPTGVIKKYTPDPEIGK